MSNYQRSKWRLAEFEEYLSLRDIKLMDYSFMEQRDKCNLLQCKMVKGQSPEIRAVVKIVNYENEPGEDYGSENEIVEREKSAFYNSQSKEYSCEMFEFFKGVYYCYTLMKFYEGGSLDKLLTEDLSRETCILIAFQISRALVSIHSAEGKIIHRDISEDNIFIESFNRTTGIIKVRLGDFEFSIQMDQDLSYRTIESSMRVGKPAHRPPLHMKNGKEAYEVGSSGDVWCFGVTLYRLITKDTETCFNKKSEFKNQQDIDNHILQNGKEEIKQRLESSGLQLLILSCIKIEEHERITAATMSEAVSFFAYVLGLSDRSSDTKVDILASPHANKTENEFLDSISQLDDSSLIKCVIQGCYYQKNRQFKKAIIFFEKSIEIFPYFQLSYEKLAKCYFDQSRKIDSKEDNYEELRKNLLQKAEKVITTCINLDPKYSCAYYRRGCIYLKLGMTDESINDFKECERLGFWNIDQVYHQLCLIYQHLGDKDNAFSYFSKYSCYRPDNVESLLKFGQFVLKDNPQFSEKLFSEALQLRVDKDISKQTLNDKKTRKILSLEAQALNSFHFNKKHDDLESKFKEATSMLNNLEELEKTDQRYSKSMLSLYFQLKERRVMIANQLNITDQEQLKMIYDDCCFLLEEDSLNVKRYEMKLKYAKLLGIPFTVSDENSMKVLYGKKETIWSYWSRWMSSYWKP
ncbi:S_TKc domain-containing protein [Naegleria gruberi]|uniref:S_TKc domain-containing protein n=1 Tax=Naegleria gruberi TaxID=5762 RepID=D2VT79_NAEGR|nr:S_TKc domain-containing protein [Naegleria gruberi]EFC40100.1 S_TKc domain-containing protein [Naegleria gruberi]|eukprot:XP_002672844.1 S_TKc domain-containing protein [Naegleria gruberi strain NEG-M]